MISAEKCKNEGHKLSLQRLKFNSLANPMFNPLFFFHPYAKLYIQACVWNTSEVFKRNFELSCTIRRVYLHIFETPNPICIIKRVIYRCGRM